MENACSERIRADAEVTKLASQVEMYLHDPNAEFRADRHRFYARALAGSRDRAAYYYRTMTTPTEAEWSTARLPGPFYPAYRVGRLATKAVREFVRRGRSSR